MALARDIGWLRGWQSGEKELRRKNMQNQLFHAFPKTHVAVRKGGGKNGDGGEQITSVPSMSIGNGKTLCSTRTVGTVMR